MGVPRNMSDLKSDWVGAGWRILSILCLLALLSFGCAMTGFGSNSVTAEERLAYDAAVAQIDSDALGAEASLSAFLEVYPRSGLADDAAEQLAELAFADGREDEGLRWLGRILSQTPNADRAAPARLKLARYEYGRNRWSTARRLLEPLRLDRLPVEDQRTALRLRVALSQTPVERISNQIDLRAALVDEIRSRRTDAASRDRLAQQLQILDEELQEGVHNAATPELDELVERRGRDEFAGKILLELTRRALDDGDFSRAEDLVRRAESRLRSEPDFAEARRLRTRTGMLEASAESNAELPPLRTLVDRARPRTTGGRGKIGVVLPLSGRFADFGQQSLRGLLLAAGLFEPLPVESEDPNDPDAPEKARSLELDEIGDGSQIRLIVRDSAGDPNRAAAMVRELEEDSDIVAIIGPIFTDESLAAAEAAEDVGIPLVSLSHREEVSAGRREVFRIRTTPADEVKVLVDHAFNELGATRFAVLYPRNRYGRGMRKLYWDAVRARGGKMVAVSSYDREVTDFSSAIRDMIGYRFITNAEQQALREREETLRKARFLPTEEAAIARAEAYASVGPSGLPLPPIVDFDVLFIPDSADKVSLIAPGLAYHEVRRVQLLGTSDWLDPELLSVAGRHVSGSVISTGFNPDSELPFVTEFVGDFERTFGEEPNSYAAQAFDAANLILVQLAAGRDDRDEIRDGLLRTRAYPGATGVLTMRPDGNARRRPFLVKVEGRRFIALD
jgi:ABC-type branched-subunit amino acid transport system substrate-binding protein/predicted negative regulator of RcsB-dependent stress response